MVQRERVQGLAVILRIACYFPSIEELRNVPLLVPQSADRSDGRACRRDGQVLLKTACHNFEERAEGKATILFRD